MAFACKRSRPHATSAPRNAIADRLGDQLIDEFPTGVWELIAAAAAPPDVYSLCLTSRRFHVGADNALALGSSGAEQEWPMGLLKPCQAKPRAAISASSSTAAADTGTSLRHFLEAPYLEPILEIKLHSVKTSPQLRTVRRLPARRTRSVPQQKQTQGALQRKGADRGR